MFWLFEYFTFRILGKETIWASTEIEKSEIHYEWTILNYKLNGKSNGEYLMSPQFSSRNDNLKWCLKLYPNGRDIESEDSVSLYIHLKSVNAGMKVHARGKVYGLNQAKYSWGDFDHLFEKSDSRGDYDYGWEYFTDKLSFYHLNGLSTNDNLTIVCSMEYSISRQGITSQSKEVTRFHEQFNIHDDLGLLLENKEFFDVTLVASDGEIRAHKAILAARSSVFLTLFKNKITQNEGDRVEMSDFDVDIVRDMLQYLYVGKVNNFFKNPDHFLQIANKYDIKGLKALCKDLIYDELTFSNSIKFLILADTYDCHMLKKKIITYMITHNGSIKNLPDFKTCKISHPQLVIEVLSAMNE